MHPDQALSFVQSLLREMPPGADLAYALQRISREIGGSALVFDEHGRVVDSVGDAPAYLFGSELTARPDRASTFHVGRWSAISRRVATTNRPLHLVVAAKDSRLIETDGRPYLDALELAVLALSTHVRGADERQRRDRELLFTAIEEGIPASREHRYWPRLAEFGFVPHAPLLVVVAERVTRRPLDASTVAEYIDEAGVRGVPTLILTRITSADSDAIVHVLIPDTEAARGFLRRRTTLAFTGISTPFSMLTDLPGALHEAELAYDVAVRRGLATRAANATAVGSAWVEYPRLGFTTWLLATADAATVRARRRAIVAPLVDAPELLHTVITYLAHDQRVIETASTLFVHPNTVRYRLVKAADLLGGDLANPRMIADLYLCLESEITAARELRGAPE